MIFVHILILFSLTLCAEKGDPEKPENKIQLAAEIERLFPDEENPASHPDDEDDDTATVEELQRELHAERARNRDLNQAIDKILKQMEDMEAKIADTQSSVVLLSVDVDDLTEEVAGVQDDVVTVADGVERNSARITNVTGDLVTLTEDVVTLQTSDQQQETRIEDNKEQISTLGQISWCGYKYGWDTANSTITYDSLFYPSTEVSEPALDINTGKYIVMTNVIIWTLTLTKFQGSSLSRFLDSGG